jgi:pimeloyl-ACP methyl ester carboxylesterase
VPVVNNLFKILTPRNIVRRSLEDVYGDDTRVTDSLVEIYRDMAIREGNRAAMIKRLNMPQTFDTARVRTLNMPTLVIWGDQDQLLPVANAYKFQRDLPNDSLVVFKGLGHIPMEERPDLVVPLVEGFIGRN